MLDIMMPDMNGYEVVAKMRGNLASKDVRVLMVSALAGCNARMLALSAGADDFVAKPVDRADLLLKVRCLLGKASADSPAA